MISFRDYSTTQANWVIRHSAWIVGALILLSALVFPLATQLRLKANLIDLLPRQMTSVKQLDELTAKVGGTSYLILVVESPNEKSAEDASNQLSRFIEQLEEIDSVSQRTQEGDLADRKLLFLSKESIEELEEQVNDVLAYHRRKNNPFYIDLLDEAEPKIRPQDLELEKKLYRVSGFSSKERDSFMQVVLAKPVFAVSNFEETEKLTNKIEKAFTDIQKGFEDKVDLGFTGPYITRYDEYTVILRDLRRTGIMTVSLITLLMLVFFRNRRAVLLAYFTLGLGILITCGFTQWAIGYLNLITAFLLGILFGLGIDFAIHFLARYEDTLKECGEVEEALRRTYQEIGQPLVTSALTTSIAFFSLTISQFQGFSHFGLIAGVGILICFLCIFYGLPALILMSHKFRQISLSSRFNRLDQIKMSTKPIFIILISGFLFTLFSIYSIPNLKFEYDFDALQDRKSTAIHLAKRIGKYFGVVLNPVAIMTPDRNTAVEITKYINEYAAERESTDVDFAVSLPSYLPDFQEEKIEILNRIDQTFEKRKNILNALKKEDREKIDEFREWLNPEVITLEDIPQSTQEQYEGSGRKISVVYVYPKSSLLNGKTAIRFVTELRKLSLPEDVTIAGEPVIYADILMMLEKDTPKAMLISLGMVIFLLLLHFRNPMHVLLVLLPVMVGLLWVIGGVTLFNFKLNYLNVTILPSILGVGIDSGIHIFHRYKREKKATFFEIMHRTGKAIVMSSLTTMAAFTSLFFADHLGMSSVGQLGLVGFTVCMVSSAFFIPSLIEFFEMKHWLRFRRS